MNLVKWLRKNNTKVMAVVVIIILFMFIGGNALMKVFQVNKGKRTVATYGSGQKITLSQRQEAMQDLEILQRLGADRFLSIQELRGLVLEELLFSDRRPSPQIAAQISQTINQNQYPVSEAEIAAIYEANEPAWVHWLLLKEESIKAGIAVPAQEVASLLQAIIPQIYPGQSYTNLMQALMNNYKRSKEEILNTMGRLLAVLQYAQLATQAEGVTPQEARYIASADQETIDANGILLDGKRFAKLIDVNEVVTEKALEDQFNLYKHALAGDISPENPNGFGYVLPPRVKLDYFIIELNSVASLLSDPTQEEIEDYYRRNVDALYTKTRQTDPNDPNSPTVSEIQSYADVVDNVIKRLKAERILVKADAILQEAKSAASEGLSSDLSVSERQEGKKSFVAIAETLKKTYPIPMHVGTTGMLSISDLNSDPYLGRLSIPGRSQYPTPLAQYVFAVDPIKMVDLQLLATTKPHLLEPIGPLRHRWLQPHPVSVAGMTMGIVRVTKAEVSQVPESLDTQYDRTGVRFTGNTDPNDTYTIKSLVEEDLKTLHGFMLAQKEAAKRITELENGDWDTMLNSLNASPGEQLKARPQDPNVFRMQTFTGLRRAQASQLQTLLNQAKRNPLFLSAYRRTKSQSILAQKLYDLVENTENQLHTPQLVVVPAENSVYLFKDIHINRLSLEDYQKTQGLVFARSEHIQGQSLSVHHFNPKNITQRNNFTWAEESKPVDRNDTDS